MKKNKFMSGLEDETNVSFTENGAKGYATTKHDLLDFSFNASSMRTADESKIRVAWNKAATEDPELAYKFLFMLRDIRGGMGERRIFRILLKYLADYDTDNMKKFLQYVPEYGRWDDLFCLFGTKLENDMIGLVQKEFEREKAACTLGKKEIFSLAKWLPSENASSQVTIATARKFIKAFDMQPKTYRKWLSMLREASNITERDLSLKELDKIVYSAVPSHAMKTYTNTFKEKDGDRFQAYIDSVEAGKTKINAGAIYPHEIYAKCEYASDQITKDVCDAQWKALPYDEKNLSSTLVVVDGSGSMCSPANGSSIQNVDISRALGLFFGQHCKASFKNTFITFSEKPEMVKCDGRNLYDNTRIINSYDDCSNTDIEAVFDLILKTATDGKLKQNELPSTVLIISDMEFDMAHNVHSFFDSAEKTDDDTLFETIGKKFKAAGYKLPKLVFWNLGSRIQTIPMTTNKNGVILLSGYSQNLIKMVMNQETDPYKALVSMLNGERYKPITLK
jgi:hypothetical protein